MTINQEAYLERIKYEGSLLPSYELLCKLQELHLLNIPFENLDIPYYTKIELDIERIYKKVILNNRGGFCFELNGLFYELLHSLGFETMIVSTRVYSDSKKKYAPDFGHLSIIVTINETRYMTDVGFGEFTFHPLKIEFGIWQKDPRGDFMLDKYQDYIRINQIKEGKSVPCSIFKDVERSFIEFKDMCEYQQTHEDSNFVNKKLITRPTENGRITLTGKALKIKKGEKITEVPFENEDDFRKYLWEYFEIREKDL